MGSCKEYLEAIYEESAGILSYERKNSLYEHLRECEACRAERQALQRMKDAFLKEGSRLSMDSVDAAQIKAQVLRQLASHEEATSVWARLKSKVGLKGLIPALAAACLAFVVVGIWRSDERSRLGPAPGPETAAIGVREKISEKELAIIRNLELLEQLDTVKVLVKVVDNKDVI